MNKTSILFLTLFLFSSCLAIESKLADSTGFYQLLQKVKPYGNADFEMTTVTAGGRDYIVRVVSHNNL